MTEKTDAPRTKPGLALFIGTGLGLGYLPKAPGTWGSLLGVVLAVAAAYSGTPRLIQIGIVVVVSLAGVWAADRTATYLGKKDPQIVVVDEVSGQLISYLGLAVSGVSLARNWQYPLAGFILFRVFDIWKPVPARRAESLPGGLGIMADDWIAGLYAALALALARQLGF